MLRKTLSTRITVSVLQTRVSRLQNRHKNSTSNSNHLEVVNNIHTKNDMGWSAWNLVKWNRVLTPRAQIFKSCFTTVSSGRSTPQSRAQSLGQPLNRLIYLHSTTWGHTKVLAPVPAAIRMALCGAAPFFEARPVSNYIAFSSGNR